MIATNFPADTPRKSLFSGSDIGGKAGQTLLKDENVAMAKKEINNSINSIKSANTGNPMSNVSSNDFIKKMDNKKGDNKKNDDIIIDDDTDDWSAIPAFLRRKK